MVLMYADVFGRNVEITGKYRHRRIGNIYNDELISVGDVCMSI